MPSFIEKNSATKTTTPVSSTIVRVVFQPTSGALTRAINGQQHGARREDGSTRVEVGQFASPPIVANPAGMWPGERAR